MKKSIRILGVLIIAVVAISFLYVSPAMKQSALRDKQEGLAKSLGVKIENYPYQADFPAGYFYSVLKPGMTYDEVHRIVRGYASVYRCYETDENYYYFSKEDDEALRFRLVYDAQGQFVKLQGEDPNSRTLGLRPGCSIGLLGK